MGRGILRAPAMTTEWPQESLNAEEVIGKVYSLTAGSASAENMTQQWPTEDHVAIGEWFTGQAVAGRNTSTTPAGAPRSS